MSSAVTLAGAGISAVGQIRQGQANQQIADYNAQIADTNAQTVVAQGAEEARRSLVNSRKVIGAGTAAYGASGVTSDGSAQWVLRNGAAQGQLNAMTIENNAAIKSAAYTNEANLDRYRGSNDETAGYIGAAGSLLKGVSQAGMQTATAAAGGDDGDE